MTKFMGLYTAFLIQAAIFFVFRALAEYLIPIPNHLEFLDHFFFGWFACSIYDVIVEFLKLRSTE